MHHLKKPGKNGKNGKKLSLFLFQFLPFPPFLPLCVRKASPISSLIALQSDGKETARVGGF